jgi:Na+/H+-translocating membrane pyrophosphatase
MVYAGSVLNWLMKKDKGTDEMQKIADYIIEGSEGFFKA